jgi:tRNA-dihydrouridine synthase A
MQTKRISVAPMMDWTTRDYRYFARLFNPHVWMYSEMVTTGAIIYGDKPRHLDFDAAEQPIVLQLGGSNPQDLATCAQIAQDWGYAEVNLNIGCPSDRVQHNKIGACLMAEPELVAECVHAMQQAVEIPITVKHRIGIDHLDTYEHMRHFVDVVAQAGCRRFIAHARIALLNGLSPKENREIPPLRYEDVYRLKRERPDLIIEINGGISTVDAVQQHLEHTDGVMIGRAAYHDPYLLAQLMPLWGELPPDRFDILDAFYPYIEQKLAEGLTLTVITRHILGLFQHLAGARKWRQALSGGNAKTLDDVKRAAQIIQQTLADVEQAG